MAEKTVWRNYTKQDLIKEKISQLLSLEHKIAIEGVYSNPQHLIATRNDLLAETHGLIDGAIQIFDFDSLPTDADGNSLFWPEIKADL